MNSSKLAWTVGNVLILAGVYILLFTGGLLVDQQLSVYAARGDTDIALPSAVARASGPSSAPSPSGDTAPALEADTTQDDSSVAATSLPRPSSAPGSATFSPDTLADVAASSTAARPSTITRIGAPAIALDRKVVEVGLTIQQQDGQAVGIWDVDTYRVGHHQNTSNPGDGGNIVLSGHSGGWQYPFNDIFYLKAGDLIELTSNDRVYAYEVSDHILVDEVGQPLAKRLDNARYIEPTDEEMITMVACWPLTGPDKFKQRIIIRAKPAAAPADGGTTSP